MALRGYLLVTVVAALLVPPLLACGSPFSQQAPEDKLEGVLNSLSLLRMKAALLSSSLDESRTPPYAKFAQNSALMIIDCKMGVQSPDVCLLHGFSQETRSVPDYVGGFYEPRVSMSINSPAAVTISAYKSGEQVCDDQHVKERIGDELAAHAAEIYDLAAQAGLLEAGSSASDAYNQDALRDVADHSTFFWRRFEKLFSKEGHSEEENSVPHMPHHRKPQRRPGHANNIGHQDEVPVMSEPIGTSASAFPGPELPHIPSNIANWQTGVPEKAGAADHFGGNVGRRGSSQGLGTTEETAAQTSQSFPFSGFLGMIPPPFLPTGISSFGLQQFLNTPLAFGSRFLIPSSPVSGFPFFPFSPGTLMALMENFESGDSRLPSAMSSGAPPASSTETSKLNFEGNDIDAAINNFAMTEADLF
ncbi:conserved hypothetical protein [Neospora caninum Liverpool]|uniref:Uncharacterized protein n=1 Tax=Neospora caninum (strain Liverpool) TaxID=572307 RepID=F0VNS9_NEOCL|nr:conserved hypothetical protein [Neospora caninum Liverpool]CBZ55375.1 conserved hypothetical protein [Neospora caninum Liverpool]CEL70111.1 TPA: hypothetical protein BN1204_057980 [Neospora caninum Liverpool]|eukprot:XP_003885403.1 conserved hypothetical protein [Neospora caninum Liverpool]